MEVFNLSYLDLVSLLTVIKKVDRLDSFIKSDRFGEYP